jgi:ribonucleoside-diphosphate reductase alpha chain
MELNLQTISIKQKKGKKKNGVGEYSLDTLQVPTHEEIVKLIAKKIGVRMPFPKDLPKGGWSEQAVKVLEERYLKKDEEGVICETPDELVWRVSWEIASAEIRFGASKKQVLERASDFYKLLIEHKFLPNTPTLMNAGVGNKAQYSGCFVLPIEDSLVGIYDALKYQAIIHQTGGGTGFSFSRLRPRGSIVKSSRGVASGPISFMKIFDASTDQIKQGGKRRGANMGILRVDHPDIHEFIHCKENGGITNFNISVAVTDKFMEAYQKDEKYDLINPKDGQISGQLSAREVFDDIAKNAWATGDPGLVFIDRINQGPANPVPFLGPIESTNPCGEQPLYPYDVCNLGSIFLTYFVKDMAGKPEIDWEGLKETSRLAVRFLDNVIEVNPYPMEQIRRVAFAIRRIGLGVGGWADMLAMLGVPYNSQEALDLAEKVMRTIHEEATAESEKLAVDRGSFPFFPISIYKNEKPRRNAAITTIAPTGTISIIANSSSGIEPYFSVAYQHIVKDESLDRTLNFFNPIFENIMATRGLGDADLMKKVAQTGIISGMEEIPQDIRASFVTAHEIDPEWHLKTQAVFQKYTDNAVSKTINLRNEATIEEVKKAYLAAWDLNCKGITVFRDGCRETQVLNIGSKPKEEVIAPEDFTIKLRPIKVEGATYKIATPLGNAFITVNHDLDGNPFEVFVGIGKAGSDVSAMAEAIGRMISVTFRSGSHMSAMDKAKEVIEQLRDIGGGRSVGYGPNKVRSLPDAIAKAIVMHFGLIDTNGNGHDQTENHLEKNKSLEQMDLFTKHGDLCPGCGEASLVFQEGCKKCYSCGYSEC